MSIGVEKNFARRNTPMPIAETHIGLVGLDSLLPPVPSADTYIGGLVYRSDGSFGGGGESFGVGSNGQIGHGPGPGS
jgi:hypothetical protein